MRDVSAKNFQRKCEFIRTAFTAFINDKRACDEIDDHERFRHINVLSPQRNVKKVASGLQFAIDFKAAQGYEKSYFSGKLQSTAKRPMIFQPFWTTSNHRVDPYRNEFSTERLVGRYRGISTRTKLEVLPRNLCPLINERRLLLTNPAIRRDKR